MSQLPNTTAAEFSPRVVMLPPDRLVQFLGTKKGLMPAEPHGERQQGRLKSRHQLCRWFQSCRVISAEIVHLVRWQGLSLLHQKSVGTRDILTAHPGPEPGIPAGGRRRVWAICCRCAGEQILAGRVT
jgi:hypothetical protein